MRNKQIKILRNDRHHAIAMHFAGIESKKKRNNVEARVVVTSLAAIKGSLRDNIGRGKIRSEAALR